MAPDAACRRLRGLAAHVGGAGAGPAPPLAAAPASSSCCDDCAGYASALEGSDRPLVELHPTAGATSAADRAAYERGVNMADEGAQGAARDPVPIAVYSHVAVPMRDGTTLYGDLYRPAADGRYPTLVNRTPYNHENMKRDYMRWAQDGFAVLEMYVRGRIESEGKWEPFRNDGLDGYDAIEWAAAQPWSSGKVASQGGSYPGQNQWMTAVLQPPSLVCMKPNVASTSLYDNWIYHGGCFRLSFNYGWGVVRMPHRVMKVQDWHDGAHVPEELEYDNILRHLPLSNGDLRSSNTVVQFCELRPSPQAVDPRLRVGVVWADRDWLAHPEYDDYWRHVSVEQRFDDVRAPAVRSNPIPRLALS